MLKSPSKGFLAIENKILFLAFILMFIAGILFTHFFVEPYFINNYQQELLKLKQENAMLNKDVSSCVKEKTKLNDDLTECKQSLQNT